MSLIRKCDRCSTTKEVTGWTTITDQPKDWSYHEVRIKTPNSPAENRIYDLCNNCTEAFDYWMKTLPPAPKPHPMSSPMVPDAG